MQEHETKLGRIILDCCGGLGNQMFEYASALQFAKHWNRTLEVVYHVEKPHQKSRFPRPFQLAEFRITSPRRQPTLLDKVLFSRDPRYRGIKFVQSLLKGTLGAETIYDHWPHTYQPQVRPKKTRSDVYLQGNWQAVGYITEMEERLRTEFSYRREPEGKNRDYSNVIAAMSCPVSVHLRFGDYAFHSTNPAASMILPKSYYDAAIGELDRRVPGAQLVIFSDDQVQAKEIFSGRQNCLFIEGNGPDTAHEDMRLMSSCHHHIIENSTFSWWGAWLNPRQEKQVFVPQYWENVPESDFADMRLSNWIAIDNLGII